MLCDGCKQSYPEEMLMKKGFFKKKKVCAYCYYTGGRE